MFLVRESQPGDLDQILKVAEHLDSYNLPFDRDEIKKIIAASGEAFAGKVDPAERAFTFVIENLETKEVVGTSMLYAQHGTRQSPHVYLDVLQDEHYSETLSKYMVHQALLIGYNYNGPTEIGGLILLPEYRGHAEGLGKLLSFARFLYIAMNREVFRDEVLSELLPQLEPDGTSRMWKHFGKRFTGLTYREADRLSKHNKEFIKSLFPQGMVHTSLFPKEVRDEIGVVGEQTRGVQKMLSEIGFRYANQIDPFDGGPHFTAKTDEITLVAQARVYQLAASGPARTDSKYLVASAADKGFRACWAQVDSSQIQANQELSLDAEVSKALELSPEDQLWAVKP
jgi:arginine N-succinyltransferase